MIRIRPSAERGHVDHGWLDTRHSFSFAGYHDPDQMGFRALRVINEDRVQPGQGFGPHPHRDMEILTYVLEGALEHADSMGTGSVIRSGEVQRMSAGTGVTHSEFNRSQTATVHLLQIWIEPARRGEPPSYQQGPVPPAPPGGGGLRLIAAPAGAGGVVVVHQDVRLYVAELEAGAEVRHPLAPGRHAWVQVTRGTVDLAGQTLAAGDGAAISDEATVSLTGGRPSRGEVLLFDLA